MHRVGRSSHPPRHERTGHALVDPGGAHDAGARWPRPVAGAIHQTVRSRDAADVFHDNPHTGKSYIVLTDVVYYLIFVAYILFTMRFAPSSDWANEVTERVTAEQLTSEVSRVGGILLIIGILHGLNIALMPVLGRLFSLNRRLPRSTDPWQD